MGGTLLGASWAELAGLKGIFLTWFVGSQVSVVAGVASPGPSLTSRFGLAATLLGRF